MDYRVKQGGLMRCCIATLNEHMAGVTEEPQEGETLDCKHEEPGNENMIYEDGVWRWNQ